MKSDTTKSGDSKPLFRSLQMIEDSLELDQRRIIAQFLSTSSDFFKGRKY